MSATPGLCLGREDGLRQLRRPEPGGASAVAGRPRVGLTLAQTEVPHGGVDKIKEHKTALRLLKGLVLEGRLIPGDAMFCHAT